MRSTWILRVVAAAALLSAAGCERDIESVRAELAVRQAVWQRELGTIRAQRGALAERLARQPRAVASAKEAPAITRMRATLDGLAQSLVDVEIQMRQVVSRLENAPRHGGDDLQKALDEDSARMAAYLQALTGNLAAASRALDDFGRTTSPGTETNSVGEGG
jgi:hypothetical protein